MTILLKRLFYLSLVSGILLYELAILSYGQENKMKYLDITKKIKPTRIIKYLLTTGDKVILSSIASICACIGLSISVIIHKIVNFILNINSKEIKHIFYAEGFGIEAIGNYPHAEGHGTIADREASHAEGWNNTSSNDNELKYHNTIDKNGNNMGFQYSMLNSKDGNLINPGSLYKLKYNSNKDTDSLYPTVRFEESDSICNDIVKYDEEYAFFIDESLYSMDEIQHIRSIITSIICRINNNGFIKVSFMVKPIDGKNIDEEVYRFMKLMKLGFGSMFTETFIFTNNIGKNVFDHLIYPLNKNQDLKEQIEYIIYSKI